MSQAEAGMQLVREARSARFWRWLGFHHARVPRPVDREGFAEGFGTSEVYCRFDWLDRLRILLSGKVHIQVLHQTDVMPLRWESTLDVAVLPPGYPMERK